MEYAIGKTYRKVVDGKLKFIRIEELSKDRPFFARVAHGELSPVGVRLVKVDKAFTWVSSDWEQVDIH